MYAKSIYLGILYLEAKCPHEWIWKSTQSPEFHNYTFLSANCHLMLMSFLTPNQKDPALCQNVRCLL